MEWSWLILTLYVVSLQCMNISYNWLQKWVKTPLSAQQIADELSVKGLEVEHLQNWQKYNADFDNLVVAQVEKVWKHPNADKLNITLVNNGSDILQVVCGAPNVAPGQKVVLAQVGCTITLSSGESFEIKKSKIRGEESNGMLCAEDEIGLGKSHEGIMVLPNDALIGTVLSSIYNNASDQVMEIGLTANRGDAASHLGTARDIAAILDLPIVPMPPPFACNNTSKVSVSIAHSNLCSTYNLVELEVAITDSPAWLQNNLKAIGIEPKNNVVDITNYIMHDMGQPMHAFDANKIGKAIRVDSAQAGTLFSTLDKRELKLSETDLVICDENGPIALAGVMGGLHSSVNNSTVRIYLECAHFNAATVRKTAKNHAINSDSSYRFERGVDPQLHSFALSAAIDLLIQLAQAKVVGMSQAYGEAIEPVKINLPVSYIEQIAGCTLPQGKAEKILTSLGFKMQATNEGYIVDVPSWRLDCKTPIDLAEEVLRIYGFDNIPMPIHLKMSLPVFTGLPRKKRVQKILDYLKAQGFFEIKTNSLVNELDYAAQPGIIAISNPLSAEMGVMRNNMLPNMLHTMAYNQNRSNEYNHYFELGKIYFKDSKGTIQEKEQLILAAMGNRTLIAWETKPLDVDYYYIKNHALRCLETFGINNAELYLQIGVSSASQMEKWGLKKEVYYAILNVENMLNEPSKNAEISAVPKFPVMVRDLSIVVNSDSTFETWSKCWLGASILLVNTGVFDIYEGKPLADNQKSIAISFEFMHPDRTLHADEVDTVMQSIILALEKAGAIIRK